jgi:hypothetical protein
MSGVNEQLLKLYYWTTSSCWWIDRSGGPSMLCSVLLIVEGNVGCIWQIGSYCHIVIFNLKADWNFGCQWLVKTGWYSDPRIQSSSNNKQVYSLLLCVSLWSSYNLKDLVRIWNEPRSTDLTMAHNTLLKFLKYEFRGLTSSRVWGDSDSVETYRTVYTPPKPQILIGHSHSLASSSGTKDNHTHYLVSVVGRLLIVDYWSCY